jgi:transposase
MFKVFSVAPKCERCNISMHKVGNSWRWATKINIFGKEKKVKENLINYQCPKCKKTETKTLI